MEVKWRIVPRAEGRAAFIIECERGCNRGRPGVLECAQSLWQRPAEGCMWNWNGNVEAPTILPSINCQGGCGLHFTMINGIPHFS